MNYYTLLSGQYPLSRNDLKALMLMYLTSEDFDVSVSDAGSNFSFNAHLPYSLSNLETTVGNLKQPIYSTEFQSTIERFDKPIVEHGDIVMCAVTQNRNDEIGKYYNEFVKIDANFTVPLNEDLGDVAAPQIDIYIGVSNSSKSEFNNPFEEAREFIVTSQQSLGELLVNIDFSDDE